MKCRQSTLYTYSRTQRALFLDIFCGNETKEYIVYVRTGRVFVQEYYRTPSPRFGRMVHEFYLCAECNYLYNSESRPHTRNIDIYTVQCVRKSEDEWRGMSSIDSFINYINSNITDAENKVREAIDEYFKTINVGDRLEYCCEGGGAAIFLSCRDDTIVSYRRPIPSPQGVLCLGDVHELYPEMRVIRGEECVPLS